jgi:hypothetical protein
VHVTDFNVTAHQHAVVHGGAFAEPVGGGIVASFGQKIANRHPSIELPLLAGCEYPQKPSNKRQPLVDVFFSHFGIEGKRLAATLLMLA